MLTNNEIELHRLIFDDNNQPMAAADCRSSGYDLKIGTIICSEGKMHDHFVLKPGCIAHIASQEVVKLPPTITGLAHVMTRFCNVGLLTLNIGVVDPGWDNCLSTSVINFSKVAKILKKGDSFLRLSFFRLASAPSGKFSPPVSRSAYIGSIQDRAVSSFSNKFLDLDVLTASVAERQNKNLVEGLVQYGAFGAFLMAVLTFFLGWGLTWMVRTIEQPPIETKGQIELLIRQNADLQSKVSSLESLQKEEFAQSQGLRSELQRIQEAKLKADSEKQKPQPPAKSRTAH